VDLVSNLASQHDPDNYAPLEQITAGVLHTVTIMGTSKDENLIGRDSAHYALAIKVDLLFLGEGSNPKELNL